jgi:multicomponent Na+:H+ antiporter subunit E
MLIWLMLVWILLWGDFSTANVISGLALAVAITVLLPLPSVPVEGRVHVLSLMRLVLQVVWQLIWSSTQVAWLAIKPGPPPRTAVLRAHLNLKSDQVRRIIYVHVIDVGSQRSIDHFHRQIEQVERLVLAAFERDREWRPARGVNR